MRLCVCASVVSVHLLPLACLVQKMLGQLARACRVVFFKFAKVPVLTSKKCVHRRPLGHDKRAARDYIKF